MEKLMGEGDQEFFQMIQDGEISPKMAIALTKVIKSAVKETLSDCHVCPIQDSSKESIGHLTGMVKDLGDGDMNRGIESIRENHRFAKKWSKIESAVGSIVVKTMVTFVIVGLMGAAFFGLFGKKIPFKF